MDFASVLTGPDVLPVTADRTKDRGPKMTRLRTLIAGGAAGTLLLGSTALPANADDDAEGDVVDEDVESAKEVDSDDPDALVIATGQSIENWNPFLQTYVIEHQHRQLQYEPLVRLSAEDYNPEPGLAEEWEVSDDGLTWTFHLREDVTWQDGEPFTAEDVEYTFHIVSEDPEISEREAAVNEILDSVEVVDEHTVELHLNEADISFETSDQVIVPKHIWEEHEDAWGDFDNDEFPIVGIGPYQTVDFETDTFIRYEAFDDYFRDRAGFDEIVYQYYTEPDTSVAALETGEVDLIGGLNEQQLARLEGQEGIEVNSAPDRRFFALRLNTGAETRDGESFGSGHPALEDVEVRQAIHHAIDREELIERVRGGHAEPATSIVPSAFSQIWWEPTADEAVNFDPEEAERLLDEAGYEMGDDGVRVGPDGESLELTMGVDAGQVERESAGQFIQEWLENIGIGVEQVISEDVQDQFDEGEVDMTFTGWGIQPNPVYNLNRQSCGQLPTEPGAGGSDTFYCNEDYDALVAQSQRETDEDARAEIYGEIQSTLYEDAPIIALWYPDVMEAYRTDKVAEFTTQPADDGMIMGQTGSWAYHEAQPAEGEGAGGTPTGVLVGTGIIILLGAGAVTFIVMRNRKTAGDRE